MCVCVCAYVCESVKRVPVTVSLPLSGYEYVNVWLLIRNIKGAPSNRRCSERKQVADDGASVFAFDTFQLPVQHNANQRLLSADKQLVACLRCGR